MYTVTKCRKDHGHGGGAGHHILQSGQGGVPSGQSRDRVSTADAPSGHWAKGGGRAGGRLDS